jgi:hypothetical protein
MRTLRLLSLLAALLAAPPAQPQQPSLTLSPSQRDSVRTWLDSLKRDPNGISLSVESVRPGGRSVAAGERVAGDVTAWHGNLDVYGTVEGNAVAVGGDVILHPGAAVRGDALAVGGKVRGEGATVGGEMRSLSALSVGAPPRGSLAPLQATRRSLFLAVGWYLVLTLIGLCVVLFARSNVETVAERIRDDFSRSFVAGVLGQIALLPALLFSIVALAVTLVGIFLIPFAIVAFFLAVAGALALGFLAMSFVTGESAMRRREVSPTYGPPPTLLYMFVGLSLYFALWALASAFTWAGIVGGLLRLVACVVTWAAVTVGFGATVLSRGGTRAPSAALPAAELAAEDYAWQTPTPVTGVAAARRPTPAPRQREP